MGQQEEEVRRIVSLKEVPSSSPPPAPAPTRTRLLLLPAFHTVDLRVRRSDTLRKRATRRIGPRQRRRWAETVSRTAADRCRTGIIRVDLRPQPRITNLAARSNNNNSGWDCRPTRSRDSLPRKARSSGNIPPTEGTPRPFAAGSGPPPPPPPGASSASSTPRQPTAQLGQHGDPPPSSLPNGLSVPPPGPAHQNAAKGQLDPALQLDVAAADDDVFAGLDFDSFLNENMFAEDGPTS